MMINPPDYTTVRVNADPPTLTSAPPKPWWQSTGVLGSVATIVVAGLAAFDINIPADAVILVITGAISLYGRIMASRPITGSLTTPTR